MEKQSKSLYEFYKANIHEHRIAAIISRLLPLSFIMILLVVIRVGVLGDHLVLLVAAAVLNVFAWLWISTTAIHAIVGAIRTVSHLADDTETRQTTDGAGDVEQTDRVLHMVVVPNYDEDEDLMAETLQCLSEAEDASSFCVVLAMEEREGKKAVNKVENLKSSFSGKFLSLIGTFHPANLEVKHMDGSCNPEVPGKASNLRYAVQTAWELLDKDGTLQNQKSTILTVADADCLFHPRYFSHISKDFNTLREQPGDRYLWTMWQAPQLMFRDFFSLPVCSRIWGYASSTFEYGGVSNLDAGGHHMVFSAYSLPLWLATAAEAWDGDTICEDHHAFLKCFFYSIHASTTTALNSDRCLGSTCKPTLQVRPVYLPVKSTSVVSPDGYIATWVARWHQAKRHAQGVAELSFAVLAAWDTLTSIPWRLQSWRLVFSVSQVLMRLWCMHMLPVCQAIGLTALSVTWFAHGQNIPMCPNKTRWADFTLAENLLCGTAGAWVLVWPVVVPMLFVTVANFMFIDIAFLQKRQSKQAALTWASADAGEPELCCCKWRNARLATFLIVMFDCCFCFSPMMTVYGFLVELLAYLNVAIWGNGVKYVTAAKAPPAMKKIGGYGTMTGSASAVLFEAGKSKKKMFRDPFLLGRV